jgi:hypothetical protein
MADDRYIGNKISKNVNFSTYETKS